MCPSHFCRVRITSPSSQVRVIQNFVESSQSRVIDLFESSHSQVTRMVESLRIIGLQARVNVESYKFQTFPIYFWLQVHQCTFSGYRSTSGSLMAIGPPVDLQWLQWIFSGYRSASGPAVAIDPPVHLQWLQVHQWIFSGYRSASRLSN